jgi:hypothetical protein
MRATEATDALAALAFLAAPCSGEVRARRLAASPLRVRRTYAAASCRERRRSADLSLAVAAAIRQS